MRRLLVLLLTIFMIFALVSCDNSEDPETQAEPTASPVPTSHSMNESIGEKEDSNKKGDSSEYIIVENRILGLFEANEKVSDEYTTKVNNIFNSIPDDINKYLLLVPTRIEFEDSSINQLSDNQQSYIKNVYFKTSNSVKKIDAYYMLSEKAKVVNDIYYRLDHHWTHLGSYYVAEAFFQAAKIPYHTLDEYEVRERKPFRGYLYALLNDTDLYQYPDDLVYYNLPDVVRAQTVYYYGSESEELLIDTGTLIDDTREGYGTFVTRYNYSHVVIEGDETSDRSILVIGDSYMNSFATWLSDNFKTVILVDPRYYKDCNEGIQQLLIDYEITDFLTLNSLDVPPNMIYFNSSISCLESE